MSSPEFDFLSYQAHQRNALIDGTFFLLSIAPTLYTIDQTVQLFLQHDNPVAFLFASIVATSLTAATGRSLREDVQAMRRKKASRQS